MICIFFLRGRRGLHLKIALNSTQELKANRGAAAAREGLSAAAVVTGIATGRVRRVVGRVRRVVAVLANGIEARGVKAGKGGETFEVVRATEGRAETRHRLLSWM